MAAGGESIPRLYTRTGDRGTTGLAGGARVDKDSPRIRSYGTYDELGAYLGLIVVELPDDLSEIREVVRRLEHELFVAQAELANPSERSPAKHRIGERHVRRLEEDIDRFDGGHAAVHSFVLSGGSRGAALLQVARGVARRAEREIWSLNREEPVRPELLQWANRLSDLLFVLALDVNHRLGVAEVPPDYTV